MYILGIETSCDETSAAIIKTKSKKTEILSNIISSQISLHKKYGGVIPEIAAREHVINILPVINGAFSKANLKPKNIDLISVTKGPGLITSLLTGVETAKTLSYIWEKPIVGINHIEGHIYSNFLDPEKEIKFPAIVLTVSGGHTHLILMTDYDKYKVIGETKDDAAGEAFDKAAKMLNLGYPGGPIVSKKAQEFEKIKKNDNITLPRPMLNKDNFDFSFSGLKTALLYQLQKDKNWSKRVNQYCFSFEKAVTEVLSKKALKAVKHYQAKTLMLSGGVSANKALKDEIKELIKKSKLDINFLFPSKDLTSDNGAMIAIAGFFLKEKYKKDNWNKIKTKADLELK